MKLLTATQKTQGQRSNDFNYCNEDEIVTFGFECDGESVDGRCGCRRAMCGVDSRKSTTTMIVAEVDVDLEEVVKKSLEAGGWLNGMTEKEITEWVTQDATELRRLGEVFTEGSIIEKRGTKFQVRFQDNGEEN